MTECCVSMPNERHTSNERRWMLMILMYRENAKKWRHKNESHAQFLCLSFYFFPCIALASTANFFRSSCINCPVASLVFDTASRQFLPSPLLLCNRRGLLFAGFACK